MRNLSSALPDAMDNKGIIPGENAKWLTLYTYILLPVVLIIFNQTYRVTKENSNLARSHDKCLTIGRELWYRRRTSDPAKLEMCE